MIANLVIVIYLLWFVASTTKVEENGEELRVCMDMQVWVVALAMAMVTVYAIAVVTASEMIFNVLAVTIVTSLVSKAKTTLTSICRLYDEKKRERVEMEARLASLQDELRSAKASNSDAKSALSDTLELIEQLSTKADAESEARLAAELSSKDAIETQKNTSQYLLLAKESLEALESKFSDEICLRNELENNLEDAESKIANLHQELSSLRQQYNDQSMQYERSTQLIVAADESRNALEQDYKLNLSKMEAELLAKSKQITEAEESLIAKETVHKEQLTKMEALLADNSEKILSLLSVDNGHVLNLQNQSEELARLLAEKGIENQNLTNHLQLCHKEFQDLCKVNSELEANAAAASTTLLSKQQEIENLTKAAVDLKARLEDSCSLYQSAEQKYSTLEAEHFQLLSIMTTAVTEANERIVSMQRDSMQQVDAMKLACEQRIAALSAQLTEEENNGVKRQRQIEDLTLKFVVSQDQTEELTRKCAGLLESIGTMQNEINASRVQLALLESENRRLLANSSPSKASPKKQEMDAATISILQAKITDLESRLILASEDNLSNAGPASNKQKLQQFVQLKKELAEQTTVIKSQREKLVSLTLERDHALSELSSLKVSLQTQDSTAVDQKAQDEDNQSVLSKADSATATRVSKTISLGPQLSLTKVVKSAGKSHSALTDETINRENSMPQGTSKILAPTRSSLAKQTSSAIRVTKVILDPANKRAAAIPKIAPLSARPIDINSDAAHQSKSIESPVSTVATELTI